MPIPKRRLPDPKELPKMEALDEVENLHDNDDLEDGKIELTDEDFGINSEDSGDWSDEDLSDEEVFTPITEENDEPLYTPPLVEGHVEQSHTPSQEVYVPSTVPPREIKPPKQATKRKFSLLSRIRNKGWNMEKLKIPILAIIITVILLAVLFFIVNFLKGDGSPQSETRYDILTGTVKMSIENGEPIAKVKLEENGSAIIQALYFKDSRLVLCESIETDFAGGEEKSVSLACYNLRGTTISDYKLEQTSIIND